MCFNDIMNQIINICFAFYWTYLYYRVRNLEKKCDKLYHKYKKLKNKYNILQRNDKNDDILWMWFDRINEKDNDDNE
jgi:hypothetical protein